MKALTIASGVNTVAAWGPGGAGATVLDLDAVATAALRGFGAQAVLLISPLVTALADPDQAGNVETSDDNVTWTVAQAYVATSGVKMYNIAVKRYLRVNNTGGTASKTTFQLLV